MSESSAPMSLRKRLVVSALVGLAGPVLALAMVSLTDDHATPSMPRSFTESVAEIAFWPGIFVFGLMEPGFLPPGDADDADLWPIVALLTAISAVFWSAVVFCLSLAWRAWRNRERPHITPS